MKTLALQHVTYGYNKLNMIKCVVVKIPINMNV